MSERELPRVLVLGATGRTGGAVAAALDSQPGQVVAVRASRSRELVQRWLDEGRPAVRLDLDDADTVAEALRGIDRVFLVTGYTGAMTHQTKILVDAAEDAGVDFVVHLGVYGDGRSTDPHFAWHELVERYLRHSSLNWANLHPNFFMENLLTSMRPREGRLPWPMGDKALGWIAGADIAAVAAKVLVEGPDLHAGKEYWLSTDVLNGVQAAQVVGSALGRAVPAYVMTPDQIPTQAEEGSPMSFMDDAYAESVGTWLRQTYDGLLDYSAVSTDTVRELLGREPIHLGDWVETHREELLALLS